MSLNEETIFKLSEVYRRAKQSIPELRHYLLSLQAEEYNRLPSPKFHYDISNFLLNDKNSIAIQGFGNAGLNVAKMLFADDFKITAVNDSQGGTSNDDGINITELVKFKEEYGIVSTFSENKAISNFSDNFFSDQALTWDDLESEQTNLDDLREEFDGLTDNLWALLNNIYNNDVVSITDVSTLQQYVFTALNGFGVRVVDMLGISEMAQQEAESTNEVGTLDAAGAQAMTDSQVLGVSAGGGNVAGYKSGRLTASFRAANAKRQVRRLVAKSALRA
jgi:hypothetical protein